MANALSNSLSQISETLSKLKSGLSTISGDEKKKFESSSAPAQLASGLNQLSGTISSLSARRAVDNAKANNNIKTTSASDNYAEQLQTLMGKVTTAEAAQKKAEAAQTNAEADLSIKEQQQGGLEAAVAMSQKDKNGNDIPATTTQDTTGQTPISSLTPQDIADYGLTPEQAGDPFTVAQVERFKGNTEIISSTITAMGDMIASESEDTKALMANIDAMTKNQQAQITAEYRKRQAGAALAGIIAGHALYSPEEHQGLIAEVVLEGKAKLDEIALEGIKEKVKLQQNLRDFKYKTFVEQSDKLTALNDLKVDTITAIQTELLRVNQEQRDNLLFDQSQEERLSSMLAEELIGASDEKIKATALANGIEPGSLMGAVREITPAPKAASKRSTQVVEIDGKKVLIDTQTGEIISEFGEEAVDFETYLQVAQDELQQSIDPNSQFYKDLKADWESTYNKKETDTVISLYGDKIQKYINDDGKTSAEAVRKITESDGVKLTREEEQTLLDYAKGI